METKEEILKKHGVMIGVKTTYCWKAILAAMEEYAQQQIQLIKTPICPKANQCASIRGGCICPKDVICPI